MKRTISLLTCLSLALPAYSETGSREPASASTKLENQKLSSLILTRDEFKKLNSQEKAAYMMSMIALGQVIEASQAQSMGKSTSTKSTAALEKVEKEFLVTTQNAEKTRGSIWFELFFENASAKAAAELVAPVIAKGKEWIAKLPNVSWASAKNGLYTNPKTAISELSSKVAAKFKGSLNLDFPPADPAQAAFLAKRRTQIETGAVDIQKFTEALDAAKKSKASAETIAKIEKDLKGAQDSVIINRRLYLEKVDPKFTAEADQRIRNIVDAQEPGFAARMAEQVKGVAVPAASAAGGVAVGAAATKALDNKDAKPTPLGDPADKEEIITEPAPAKAASSPKEAAKACIFGGRPSVWVQFPDPHGIKCTQPDPKTTSCKIGGKTGFVCEDYGIYVHKASIKKQLCVPLTSLDNLSARCQSALDAIASSGKEVQVDDQEWQVHADKLKALLESLESSKRMVSSDGDPKTIAEYCAGAQDVQKAECDALSAILKTLQKSAASQIAARSPTPSPSSAAATSSEPKFAPPAPAGATK